MSDDDKRLPPEYRRNKILRLLPHRRSPARGRKTATAQLGKRRVWWRRGGRVLFGVLRRIRFRILVSPYRKAVKKLCDSYVELIKNLVEDGETMDAMEARVMMQAYATVPMMPMSFSRRSLQPAASA